MPSSYEIAVLLRPILDMPVNVNAIAEGTRDENDWLSDLPAWLILKIRNTLQLIMLWKTPLVIATKVRVSGETEEQSIKKTIMRWMPIMALCEDMSNRL